MAETGAPWQLEFEKLEQRCGYLLTSGQWSDCIFMVGPENNQEAIPAHKLVLAMASPVFEAMFYGGLSDRIEPIVSIPDVPPKAFRALLQYIYTGSMDIGSFDMAWDLLYGAKKYMLPHLVTKCIKYICSVLGPSNACRAYEFSRLFDEKSVMCKCIQIISSNTKEVLNDSSFEEVELNTVIALLSLEHLNVDSELDLFNAVSRYAKATAKQRAEGQISPSEADRPPSEKLSECVPHPPTSEEKELLSVKSSQTSPAAELDTNPSKEVVTSEPTADKEHLKKEEPTIRTAIQKIRFLSLTAAQFAEGPALSDLLTKDESFAVLMNIASSASAVPMPSGFSEHREGRQQLGDSDNQSFKIGGVKHKIKAVKCGNPSQVEENQSFKIGALVHTINALKCGNPSQVEEAAWVAAHLLRSHVQIVHALDKGMLDALVPALTEGNDKCKFYAALAIRGICARGWSSQHSMLAASAALQPFCRLLGAGGYTCGYVLGSLSDSLKVQKVELSRKLREIGVPQLLISVQKDEDDWNRERAVKLLKQYFPEVQ